MQGFLLERCPTVSVHWGSRGRLNYPLLWLQGLIQSHGPIVLKGEVHRRLPWKRCLCTCGSAWVPLVRKFSPSSLLSWLQWFLRLWFGALKFRLLVECWLLAAFLHPQGFLSERVPLLDLFHTMWCTLIGINQTGLLPFASQWMGCVSPVHTEEDFWFIEVRYS